LVPQALFAAIAMIGIVQTEQIESVVGKAPKAFRDRVEFVEIE